jgi:hypothetical protein
VISVTLTDDETAAVTALAALRLRDSVAAGLGQAHGRGTQLRVSSELTAAAAEYAVSKALRLHWPLGLRRFHQPDVGSFHVRSCKPEHNMIIRDDDPDNEPFLLVWVDGKTFTLAGWCYPCNVKRPEYRQAPNGRPPAWFVPHEALEAVEEIPA